jgi:hypothetical protein
MPTGVCTSQPPLVSISFPSTTTINAFTTNEVQLRGSIQTIHQIDSVILSVVHEFASGESPIMNRYDLVRLFPSQFPASGGNFDVTLRNILTPARNVEAGERDVITLTVTDVCGLSGSARILGIYFGTQGPGTPDLQVQCIHDPIWPNSTDTITITARAVDGTLAPRVADSIEIWVNDRTRPVDTGTNVDRLSVRVGPFPDSTNFSYACRVLDDGGSKFSGWKTVSIDTPADSRAIPVLFTGVRHNSIDIVFIADQDSYIDGATSTQFLTRVREVIERAYYSESIFLNSQDRINFWIARDTGDADGNNMTCTLLQPPINWNTAYTFAQVGAILHEDSFRDCANGGVRAFSSEPYNPRTILHETGHQPFGMADEYCCDGGYFQPPQNPNLFAERADCEADSPGTVVCREFVANGGNDWFTWDQGPPHLMEDNGRPRPLDERRINWMFGTCVLGQC